MREGGGSCIAIPVHLPSSGPSSKRLTLKPSVSILPRRFASVQTSAPSSMPPDRRVASCPSPLAAAHPYGTRSRRAVPGVSPAGGAQVSRSDGHVLKLSSNLGQIRRELREALSRDCVGSGRSAKYHSESPCDEEQVCQRSFPPKSSPKAVMAGRSQDSSSQPLFCTLVRGRRTSVGTRLSCADKR